MIRYNSWPGLCWWLSPSPPDVRVAPGHGSGHVPVVPLCDDPPRLQHLLHQHVLLHQHHQVHRGADVPVHPDDHPAVADPDILAHCWNILVVTFSTQTGGGAGCKRNDPDTGGFFSWFYVFLDWVQFAFAGNGWNHCFYLLGWTFYRYNDNNSMEPSLVLIQRRIFVLCMESTKVLWL